MTVHATGVQAAFYGINLAGGGIGLVLLLATTLLSRIVRKQPVLINLYCACIYEAYAACILYFADRYPYNDGAGLVQRVKPGSPLCVAQAMLFTGTPTILASAAVSVVYHIFTIVHSINNRPVVASSMPSFAVIIFPYAIYILVSIPIVIVAACRPDGAIAHQLYCYLDLPWVSYFVGIMTGALLLIALVFQIWLFILLRRDYAAILARTAYDVPLLFRVALFSVYVMITFGLSIQAVSNYTAVVPDLLVATVPLAVLVIFGSQRDVLIAWRTLLLQKLLRLPPSSFSYPEPSPHQHHNPESEFYLTRQTDGGQTGSFPLSEFSALFDTLESSHWRPAAARAKSGSKFAMFKTIGQTKTSTTGIGIETEPGAIGRGKVNSEPLPASPSAPHGWKRKRGGGTAPSTPSLTPGSTPELYSHPNLGVRGKITHKRVSVAPTFLHMRTGNHSSEVFGMGAGLEVGLGGEDEDVQGSATTKSVSSGSKSKESPLSSSKGVLLSEDPLVASQTHPSRMTSDSPQRASVRFSNAHPSHRHSRPTSPPSRPTSPPRRHQSIHSLPRLQSADPTSNDPLLPRPRSVSPLSIPFIYPPLPRPPPALSQAPRVQGGRRSSGSSELRRSGERQRSIEMVLVDHPGVDRLSASASPERDRKMSGS